MRDKALSPNYPLKSIRSLVQYEMSLERAEAGSGSVHDGEMKTIMKLEGLNTIEQLEDFLSDTQAVAFSVRKCHIRTHYFFIIITITSAD